MNPEIELVSKKTLEQDLSDAVELHKSGDLDQAERLYLSILKQRPDSTSVKVNYSILAIAKENYLFAAQLIEEVVAAGFVDENILVNYAICMIKLEEFEKATTVLNDILVVNPDSQAANGLLARISLPGLDYMDYLSAFHQSLSPETYLEIGVDEGKSIAKALSSTKAIGIDPTPRLESATAENIQIYAQKSDDFFAEHDVVSLFNGRRIDLAFIDGLHVFEAALKDFINVEKNSHDKTVVLIHDCIPLNKATSSRERVTKFWSGDVWKLVLCLKQYRPELNIFTIPAPPTGLCVISKLDAKSDVLSDSYESIIGEYVAIDYDAIADDKDEKLNVVEPGWDAVRFKLGEDFFRNI